MKRQLYLGACVAGLFVAGLTLMSNSRILRANRFMIQESKPKIQWDEESFDFGKLKEGDIVDHVFGFVNVGPDTLKITNVKASCGCTAALASANEIAPGARGEIKTTFNSRGKSGKVKKTITVHSNNYGLPLSVIYLMAEIESSRGKDMSMHPNTEGDMHGSYFDGKCVTCHVIPGEGKFGRELFAASCEMCHGVNGSGAVARAINNPEFLAQTSDVVISEHITRGSPSNPMMLGFSKQFGGPLDAKQIASLVDYIRGWHKNN